MVYKVILPFFDLSDGAYKYEEGDTFPREGYSPDSVRVESLLNTNNVHGRPFIEEVKKKPRKKSGE